MDVDSVTPNPPADDPVLYMSNERFTVPEVLFHPSDVGSYIKFLVISCQAKTTFSGLDQCGLSQTIANSISTLPEDLQGLFWGNIGLTFLVRRVN